MSAPEPLEGELSATLDALAQPELVPAQRRRLLGRLARQAPRPWRPRATVQWVVDAVTELAPQVAVRDLPTLGEHHRELAGEALADRLVRNAARATAGVGVACGGLAAVKWVAPPTLLAAPVLLGAETVAVVAIELKLVGELHAVYRVGLPSGRGEQAIALLRSWAQQRGVDPLVSGAGFSMALGTAARKELADRLVRRFGRNLPTLAPMLAGAAVASYLNQRATRALGHKLRSDLAPGGPGEALTALPVTPALPDAPR